MKNIIALAAVLLTTVACSEKEQSNSAYKEEKKEVIAVSTVQVEKNSEMTTTETGLKYKVLTKGKGTQHPKATDRVKVHYHGTLLDGTVFDSSVDRGESISFPLNRVIKGWTEGLQLMVVGEKTRFIIPSELAYGKRGAGGKIGPDMTLIFEVELLGINE